MMDYSRALRGTRGAYFGNKNDENHPRPGSIQSLSYTKEYDFTFSLGRPTNRPEVVNLIRSSGAIGKDDNIHDYLQMITINDFNEENGQVLVRCIKPGLADHIVEKLLALEVPNVDIRRCHSYTNKEVAVKFRFIHPSVNVKRDVVEKFLNQYGKVKEWHPQRDNVYKLLTGSWTFIMYEDDLKKKPLPYTVYINGVPSSIYYKTRVKMCFNCKQEGHFARECPNEDNICYSCKKPGHFARDCTEKENTSQNSDDLPGLEGDKQFPSLSKDGKHNPPPFAAGIRPEDERKKEETSVKERGKEKGAKSGDLSLVDWFLINGGNDNPADVNAANGKNDSDGIKEYQEPEESKFPAKDGSNKIDASHTTEVITAPSATEAPLASEEPSATDASVEKENSIVNKDISKNISDDGVPMDDDERKRAVKRNMEEDPDELVDGRADKQSKLCVSAAISPPESNPEIKLSHNIGSTQLVNELLGSQTLEVLYGDNSNIGDNSNNMDIERSQSSSNDSDSSVESIIAKT